MKEPAKLLVPLAALCFATAGPATAVALTALRPDQIVALRCSIAAVALFVFLSFVGWKRLLGKSGWPTRLISAGSGLLFGIHLLLFVAGVEAVPFVSAMVILSLEPVVIVAAGYVFFREKPSRLQVLGIALATVGIFILGVGAEGGGQKKAAGGWLGYTIMVSSTLVYGGYYAFNRAMKARFGGLAQNGLGFVDELFSSWIIYSVAALVGWGAGAFFAHGNADSWNPLTGRVFGALLALGTLPTLLGHTFGQLASRRVSPAWLAMSSPGESLGSLAIGAVLLGTVPTAFETFGGLLILAAALIVILGDRSSLEWVALAEAERL